MKNLSIKIRFKIFTRNSWIFTQTNIVKSVGNQYS